MTFTLDFTSIGPILGYFASGVVFCIILVKWVSSRRNAQKRREASLVESKNEEISRLNSKLELQDAEIDHIKGVNSASSRIKLNGVKSKIVIEKKSKPWLSVRNKEKFQSRTSKTFRPRSKDSFL